MKEIKTGPIVIDNLTAEFNQSVGSVAQNIEKQTQMLQLLREFNPRYEPVLVETESLEAQVLAQVVAGVYAPIIHGFSLAILKNIQAGILPRTIMAPPRDAIPLRNSLSTTAHIQGVPVQIHEPFVNRNTAGIANNQRQFQVGRSPHLSLHLDQIVDAMEDDKALEIETGIYGTTSLEMAAEFKERGIEFYAPVKLYGLGPNLSYVHALLSGGEWLAETSSANGLVEPAMVLLDTMEELGMEKIYQSVEKLTVTPDGLVVPVVAPVSQKETEIYQATNAAIIATASQYIGMGQVEVRGLIEKVPWLIEKSKQGFPFTFTEAIPPMDSKEEHYAKVRESGLFDYPDLIL